MRRYLITLGVFIGCFFSLCVVQGAYASDDSLEPDLESVVTSDDEVSVNDATMINGNELQGPALLMSGDRATAVTLDQVNNNVLATPANVWNEKLIYYSLPDINGEIAYFTVNYRQYIISDEITQNGHTIYGLRGYGIKTLDALGTANANIDTANGKLDTVVTKSGQTLEDLYYLKTQVDYIKNNMSGSGSQQRLDEIAGNMKIVNSLLLVMVCMNAAVLGSNILPMLVKGWRR